MKRVSKAILISLAIASILGLVALFGVNLYVQSPGVQTRIQAELSKALRLPLVIRNTSLSLWSDLRINGIAVPAETGNFLEASSFSARYRLLPLLRKQLVIYDMRIESPKVIWLQNADGKWELPALAKAPVNAAEVKAKPERTARPHDRSSDFKVLLDGFRVNGGSVDLIGRDGTRVALFTDVNMQYAVLTADRVEGTASIGRLAYSNWLVLENVRSPFNYMGGEFSLPAIEATAGGGPVTGSFQLSPNGKHSLFTAQARFEGVDAARLAADAGSSAEQITGVLRGAVEVRGSSREVARMEGKGRLEAANGQFRRLELLQTIGHVLQIEELANLHLKQGQADFHIADEKVFIDTLVLDSPDLRLSGQGYVRLDGKVSLDAQLAMDARDLNRSPSIVRNLFKPTETSGQSAVDFKVFGKLSNLKTDLAEKVIGKTIGDQFESFVSGLFGTKKKKNDKKKEDKKRKVEEETQSIPVPPSGEAPSPSPAGRPVPGPPSGAAPSANSGAARSGAHLAARGG